MEEENASHLKADAAKIQARLQQIRSQKAAIGVGKTHDPERDVKTVTKRILTLLKIQPDRASKAEVFEAARLFMASIFEKFEIDFETLEVTAVVKVPDWAMKRNGQLPAIASEIASADSIVCAKNNIHVNNSVGAERKAGPVSLIYVGKYVQRNRRGRRPSFTFRRVTRI